MKKFESEEIYELEKSYHDSIAINAMNAGKWSNYIPIWEKPSWEYVLETIENLEGKRILDIGCGFGRESIVLAKKGAIVTGIDISDKCIELAKKRVSEERLRNINFETLNVNKLDYADFFDVVFCHASLHHFPDVQMVVSKGYDSLKNGGIMIAQEPKSENLIAIIGRRVLTQGTSTEHPFSKGELESVFRNRFGNMSVKYFYILSPLCLIFEKIALLRSDILTEITFKVFYLTDKMLLSFNIFKKYSWVEVVWSIKR